MMHAAEIEGFQPAPDDRFFYACQVGSVPGFGAASVEGGLIFQLFIEKSLRTYDQRS
jgi:hypothetical protein